MKKVAFEPEAFEQLGQWATEDKKIFKKILELIRDIQRDPFAGIGKPEPLKYELQGYWSRRITDEHRLVYKVQEDLLIILTCKYHYEQ
ncbi:MAG: Txe/YoeB family addiction module toxin [Nostoc sp.]|uniref:Endoribonuclease YoeB n=2 Tax=Nostoc TaxID=1177 RepID=A0ABS8I4M2_9NOSO|nr:MULTISPECIES: Txe/YoeB family addiction module toxin [Nostoc]MBE9104939.1 Txe/YoeB family addiction module toxin [Nostoc cf. edaphicum LEGE 07299]MCC5598507.1 Txe/YoeB family addiction module toxin [Nostoc favosum CHAB5714]MCC5649033.1 Txe/YoeB family addiction module toxin [Nostoc sp. XA013]